MEKQNIRIAQIKGYIVKKRCRKQEFEIVQGVGSTSEEALQSLKEKYQELKQGWKDWRFQENVMVYNAIRNIYDTYSTICQPLIPEIKSDNVEYFELAKI